MSERSEKLSKDEWLHTLLGKPHNRQPVKSQVSVTGLDDSTIVRSSGVSLS